MGETPILILAVLFVVFARLEWKRGPLCARVSLGAATVFALAALKYPGLSTQAIVDHTEDSLSYLVNVARGLGLAAVLWSAWNILSNRVSED
jgi:hypothetical protein